MTRARLDTGRRGEEIAAAWLAERGYHILELNFRCPLGEMDIVARQGDVLVFVEVRTRRTDRFGRPLESVGSTKQRKLSQIALYYLQRYGLEGMNARFDVVGIRLSREGCHIELVRDAFDVTT